MQIHLGARESGSASRVYLRPQALASATSLAWPLRGFSVGGHWLCKPERKNLRSVFVDSSRLEQELKPFGQYPRWALPCQFMQVRLKETWIKFGDLFRIVVILDSPSKIEPEKRACVQAVYLGNDPKSEREKAWWYKVILSSWSLLLLGLALLRPFKEPYRICLIYAPALILL